MFTKSFFKMIENKQMKLTLEKFDLSALTSESILMVEVTNQTKDDFERAQRVIKALFDSGKIPRGVLVLVNSKHSPINFKEIPEEVMNKNGWVKLRIKTESDLPQFSLDVPPRTA